MPCSKAIRKGSHMVIKPPTNWDDPLYIVGLYSPFFSIPFNLYASSTSATRSIPFRVHWVHHSEGGGCFSYGNIFQFYVDPLKADIWHPIASPPFPGTHGFLVTFTFTYMKNFPIKVEPIHVYPQSLEGGGNSSMQIDKTVPSAKISLWYKWWWKKWWYHLPWVTLWYNLRNKKSPWNKTKQNPRLLGGKSLPP